MKNLKYLVLPLLAMVAVHAHAYDFEVNGIYYNVISKTDLTCEVTSESQGRSLYSGNVVIPASVTFKNKTLSVVRIGEEAFSCTDITNVTIPNSVTSIGNWAFYYCSSLEAVVIPRSVTAIGRSAFGGCSNLKNITIPNSVTSIGEGAFDECSSLETFAVPNSLTAIDSRVFSGCSNLKNITIPNSATFIGSSAFGNCI